MKPHRKNSSSPALDRGMSRQVQGGLTVAALVLVPLLAVAGGDAFRAALDFAAGVLSLVSLTAAVAWGLMATDRLLLSPRHRLLAQAVHRATAVASLGFLLLHVTVKVSLGHVALIGALVPFGLGITGTNGLIGLGSLAGLLMIVAATTGAMRSAFASPGRIAGRWRALHMVAYPAWCFALMHGLYTGRPAAPWVTTMYCLSVCGVAAAVSMRLLPRPARRRVAERITTLAGVARETPEPAGSRRDPLANPLPGAAGIPPQSWYEQRSQRDSVAAQSPAPALGPPRLAAPAPPLYEAVRPAEDPFPAAGPFAGRGADPFSGRGATGPSPGPGTGISAGYRAVSLGTDAAARMPEPGPFAAAGGQTGDIPFAERIPMTEELPVVSAEPPGRPGMWPAPSPPPPGNAFAPPAPSPYDTGALPTYGPHAAPPYDTGSLPAYDTGAVPTYDTGSQPAYDTGAVPTYDTGSQPAYDTGAVPTYDTGSQPAYDTGALPTYGTAPLPAYDSRGLPPYHETEPSPGPPFPPPAGEPWTAPAGDRP